MATRRDILIALGWGAFAGLPVAAQAQQPRIFRIGMLWGGSAENIAPLNEAVTDGLRKLGYVDGKNVAIERRFADGNPDRLPGLADELVRLRVDVIFAGYAGAAEAAKQATAAIPIVFGPISDPVRIGLVASLARPGGNVTGISNIGIELSGKRLELLKATFPGISRVAVLGSGASGSAMQLAEAERAAKTLGLTAFSAQLGGKPDFADVSALLGKSRANAILFTESAVIFHNRKLLAEVAAKMKLPTMCGQKQYVDAGGLMSYGPNYEQQFRSAARLVDKVLKGASPADIPVEQAAEFEFVINMKTARALGLTIPQSILVRADRVIE